MSDGSQSHITSGTFRADSLDKILGLFRNKSLREHYLGDADIWKTEGPVADTAGQMDMSCTVKGIVVMAHAVLVGARTVIYVVKQVGFTQQCQSPEYGGLVHGRKCVFYIRQAESPGELAHLAQNEKADRRNAYSCLLK